MNRITPFAVILVAVLVRLLPHGPNFAPIGAMALFGGARLDKKYSLLIVFATLLISDYLLLYVHPFSPNFFDFSRIYSPQALIHSTTGFVYFSFLLISLLGVWLSKRVNARNIIGASLASSILFFLITNFGVWAMGGYSRDISGLWQSYMMGLPFLRNTVLSDLFYSAAFFGSYELIGRFLLKRAKVTAVNN